MNKRDQRAHEEKRRRAADARAEEERRAAEEAARRAQALEERLKKLEQRETGGRGADGVIVAVAAASAYAQAIDMLKEKRGRLLIFAAGYPAPKWELDPNTVHYRRMVIVGTYGADYVDFKEAANLINMRAANFEELVEEKIPLDQIQHAFERACEPGMFRISVICNEE